VTSFTPSSGQPGTQVTISGSGFTGATAVKLGSANASYAVLSDTQIRAYAPNAAGGGYAWSVTTPGGTGTSASNFTLLALGAPTITSFTPSSGPRGSTVTITGTGFVGVSKVQLGLNAFTASFTVLNPGQIRATVPSAAFPGFNARWWVTTPKGSASSAAYFTVS